MYPVHDIKGIETLERKNSDKRVVIILIVKPTDQYADTLIDQFNYYHFASRDYCSIYAAGFCGYAFDSSYSDAKIVCSVDGRDWWYSDRCFVDFCSQLSKRTKWNYCGEPEILILRSFENGKHSSLNFSNYVSIDACEGLRAGYIDSIPRLMEALIRASRDEVDNKKVLKNATALSASEVAKNAIATVLEMGHCPTSLEQILLNRAFYRSARSHR